MPVRLAAPRLPQLTTQVPWSQLRTVQPDAGQVTRQSAVPAQSTSHFDDELHDTSQRWLPPQPTSQLWPAAHVVVQSVPFTQSCAQGAAATHAHALPAQTSLVPHAARPRAAIAARIKMRLFMM